jgi:hypothetical protein
MVCHRMLVLAVCLIASTFTWAEVLYRCEGPGGVPLFANIPCSEDSEPLQLPEIGVIGSDDKGAELQRRTSAMAAMAGIDPAPTPRSGQSAGLSFGERMALQQLEIRRDGLRRDVGNQALTRPYRKSLAGELKLVEARIRELEKRR